MSILALVKENLNKQNKISNFQTEKHKKDLNFLFSKNKEDIMQLKNVVDASVLLQLAPAWDLINNFETFKSLGLNTIEEMHLYHLIHSKTTINNEEDKNWLISIVPKIVDYHPRSINKMELNHLKLFSSVFIEVEEEREERFYLSEFLSNKNLFSFTDEQLLETLNLIKECNTVLANGRHLFTFIMEHMNTPDIIFLLKQYLEEDKDSEMTDIQVNTAMVLFYLNEMNVHNIDLKNLKSKANLIIENYLKSNDLEYGSLLKPFIPYFKEGNDLNVLNEDFLFNLNKSKYRNTLKEIVSKNIKSKNFQKNMKELLETTSNDEIGRLGSFYYNWFIDEDNKKYHKLINENQLSLDELKDLMNKKIVKQYYSDYGLESVMDYLAELKSTNEVKNITNKEILLHIEKSNATFSKFIFDNFKNEKVDTRITLFNFLNSINLTKNLGNKEFNDKFISKVKELKKPINLIHFYKEFEGKQVDKETAFVLYILKDSFMDKFIDEAQTEQDFTFILKNRNELNYSISLLENKKSFILNSELIKTYFEKMNISNEFKTKYFENILEFYQKGNIDSTMSYIKNISSETQAKNIGLLVKAELAGKLQEVKFDKMDLMKELIMNKIDDELAEKWFKNTRTKEGRFTIKESSDFKTLFEMGEKPINSCMSYNRGSYNHCLLSIFDSNKKLVTVYDGETLVGRAIVRFTKIKKGSINENGLGFKDIEDEINDVNDGNTIVDENEMKDLGIFIERLYTGYDSSQRAIMCDAIVKLMKEKAEDLGVKLYLSASYDYKGEAERHSDINVFISHSKNGSQYIDSLGGSQDAMSGGRYVKGRVYEIKLNNELVLN